VETKKELAEKREREAKERKKVENMQASLEKAAKRTRCSKHFRISKVVTDLNGATSAQGDDQVGVIRKKRKNVSIFD
jgi:hypothetical protein